MEKQVCVDECIRCVDKVHRPVPLELMDPRIRSYTLQRC